MCMFLIDFFLLCPFKRVLREIYTPPEAVTTFSSLPAGWQDVGSSNFGYMGILWYEMYNL